MHYQILGKSRSGLGSRKTGNDQEHPTHAQAHQHRLRADLTKAMSSRFTKKNVLSPLKKAGLWPWPGLRQFWWRLSISLPSGNPGANWAKAQFGLCT